MPINRRMFVAFATAALVAPAVRSFAAERPFKAIAFDGFPITDPRPVFAKVEELFPGRQRACAKRSLALAVVRIHLA